MSKTIQNILKLDLSNTKISPSYYDSSWIYLLKDKGVELDRIIKWFITSQNSDGSWGSAIFFREDRLLNTLAVINCLSKLGIEYEGIDKAKFFCKTEALKYANSIRRPVAFELTFPFLWYQVFSDQDLPAELNILLRKSQEKIEKIPLSMVLSEYTTLLHTLEVFDGKIENWHKLERLKTGKGNIGNSPAATIFYASKTNDQESIRFLKDIQKDNDGLFPVNYPLDIFERNWILYFAKKFCIDIDPEIEKQVYAYILDHWTSEGICWSKDFKIPDIDDTAISWLLLNSFGVKPFKDVFKKFINGDTVTCFPGEIDASPTHLVHFIEAVQDDKEYEKQLFGALKMVLDFQYPEGFWLDKWHLSPYYSTSQVILSCDKLLQESLRKACDWIIRTQKDDGGWGGGDKSTKEETAYAILSLDYAFRNKIISELPKNFLLAKQYLDDNFHQEISPQWIDKNLYTPYSIVLAIIEVASLVIKRYEKK